MPWSDITLQHDSAASTQGSAEESQNSRTPSPDHSRAPADPHPRRAHPGVVALALIAGILGGVLGSAAIDELTAGQEAPTVTPAALPFAPGVGGQTTGSVAQIARRALPSVVLITVDSNDQGGVGSGFVVDEAGYILTNLHVVQAAQDADEAVNVKFMDGKTLDADIVGADPAYDIAVLKVDQSGLVALPLAESEDVEVGMPVVAVGAPLGLEATVTSGIVSALDRPVVAGDVNSTSFINAVQTDAAINPGNSGGPLLDLSGRVIGVNSAIAQLPGQSLSPGGSIGLGFAIPADQVARTSASLIETGTSDYPVIGVLVDLAYTGEGARVLTEGQDGSEAIFTDGPADEAGVRPGDIILSIDGRRVADGSDLIVRLRSRQIGETVELLLRNDEGSERTVELTLQGASQ